MSARTAPALQTAVALIHPARLRARALAHGLGGVELGPFRYLELYCGRGANLLPLANQFPEASFVGVEPDAPKLAEARAAVADCGLNNVQLLEGTASTQDDDPFDYVVADGVYSWVEGEAQRALLAACSKVLAPTGVACLSYNCMPGWSLRGVVRDVLMGAGRGRNGPDRLTAARAMITKLQRHLQPDHPYRALLSTELSLVQHKSDAELLDDHLADRNEPLYVSEFVDRAQEHGLAYLSEMVPATPDGALELEVPPQLMQEGLSRVEAEQYLDLLCYRQLRVTLLRRQETVVRDVPASAVLASAGYYAGALLPSTEEPLLGPGKVLRFETPTGVVIEADRPLLKAVLLVLSDLWPAGLKAQPLVSAALSLLRERNLQDAATEAEIEAVLSDLVQLSYRQQIELLPWTPVVARETSEQPKVGTLTRWEAAQGSVITSARHEPVPLDAATRAIARLLDGTRDLAVLTAELGHLSDAGELTFDPEPGPAERGALFGELATGAVSKLGKLGLLVAK